MLLTSSECGSSGSATEKTWEVTIHNSVIKQKINVFKSYLFKLLFILMILSSSSLLEEKKINLTSIKACPESKGRFTLKQLFLSSLKYNTCVTSINYGNVIYPSKLSSNSSFSKESFPVLLMNRVPSILGILADFFFFHLLYGTHLTIHLTYQLHVCLIFMALLLHPRVCTQTHKHTHTHHLKFRTEFSLGLSPVFNMVSFIQ